MYLIGKVNLFMLHLVDNSIQFFPYNMKKMCNMLITTMQNVYTNYRLE